MLMKFWILLSGADLSFWPFLLLMAFWNLAPAGVFATYLYDIDQTHPSLQALIAALVVGAFTLGIPAIEGTGCYAMWWCEPDAQLALIWIFLPVYELGAAVIAMMTFLLFVYLLMRLKRLSVG